MQMSRHQPTKQRDTTSEYVAQIQQVESKWHENKNESNRNKAGGLCLALRSGTRWPAYVCISIELLSFVHLDGFNNNHIMLLGDCECATCGVSHSPQLGAA